MTPITAHVSINALILPLLAVALIALGGIVVMLMRENEKEKSRAHWKSLADKLDLSVYQKFFIRPFHITGTYKGCSLRAENYQIDMGSEHSRVIQHRNILKIDFKDPGWKKVKIIRYEAFEKLAIAFGGADLKVGSAEFDKSLRIASKEVPEPVLNALRRPDVQKKILEVDSNSQQFLINKGQLFIRTFGAVESPNELQALLDGGVDLVNLLESATGDVFPNV